ncbi:MAG: BamA/TamA family outer membrane protein [Acidobacteriota bacterium]|nr:BamA/TamA family outer membrane protein [Acidobacteriota bacterium]
MVLKAMPAGQRSYRYAFSILLAGCFVFGGGATGSAHGQSRAGAAPPEDSSSAAHAPHSASADAWKVQPIRDGGSNADSPWKGLPVRRIAFEGVAAARLAPLPDHLAQAIGAPLSQQSLAQSLRQLYATGLFETIDVEGAREGDGVALVFKGTPRMFIGTVSVDGAKGATINTQLQYASRLASGTRFTQARLDRALEQMRQALADNGFHEPVISHVLTPLPEEQLVDIAFHVVSGPRARVDGVEVTGDAGMSAEDFRRYAHLRDGSTIDHDTANRALAGVLKHYQKHDRLEAEIKLESQTYMPDTDKTRFRFSANRGPVVKVSVEGANVSSDRLKRLIPVFEEGTVDEDLLNEGSRRLRDYFQRQGYFDVKVEHRRQSAPAKDVVIVYTVTLGQRRRVVRVTVAGNHYFDSGTLRDLLSVHAANTLDRHGLYSQALVTADIGALTAVYQNNGFSKVKITPATSLMEAKTALTSRKGIGLAIVYNIDEGQQQRVGAVQLEGNNNVDAAKLLPLLNTSPGQLFSPQNVAGDRDALMTDYLSRGFDQAQVSVSLQSEAEDASKMDVTFHITEGKQIFVRKVLLTGLHYTRPDTVARAVTLHPGDPLNQSALAQTQRNLYDFALFNEVNTAIQNPNGGEAFKTVLVQTTEARRWALTYGLGFEAQTGTPQNNCGNAIASGEKCNPNGKTGISPRVLFNVTRNNLFGREQSASIQSTYGLLEQQVNMLFQNPHFHGNRNFGLTLSAGYANSQDVTTYVASKLEAGMRWAENFNTPGSALSKANTFIYEIDFRRVKVAASSLQVGIPEIPSLSAAVRVAGPGVTWIRDTRDSPLDAHRGTYSSFQEFFSNHAFGSEAQFNRLDVSNSSYYGFNKDRLVVARNTRYGQERAYGNPSDELIPLPERMYAGGPTSLRAFSINAAGPRDPYTGFPIGGAGALVNSTELRLPPPTLPWFGDSVSFVVFHDMGNVFTNAGDAWASALRVRQPERDKCKILGTPPGGQQTSTVREGECSFNYFAHAAGLGMRYHTPVGPIRLDFSYTMNPPIFPVNEDYSNPAAPPHVGEARHFNFVFSLGQSF